MLKKTFCHVDGISANTEKVLWERGIPDWEYFLENCEEIDFLTNSKVESIKTEIFFSQENLVKNNISYFKNKLPSKEHYRLAGHGKIAFVDIETTGLSRWTDKITMIGIYDGKNPRSYIYGQDLEDAYERLKEFDIIVSFNGKQFDLPFIEHKSGNKYDVVHLDLRFMLKEFGFAGGLKKIEAQLGISRDEEIAGVDGFEAVRLWRKYQNGDKSALDKLLKYNYEDIVNLKYLLEYYLEEKKKELFSVENNIFN